MKKTLIIFALVLTFALGALTGCQVTTPEDTVEYTSVVTLDVNPGIDIYLSAEETVVDIKASNEDAQAVVDELKKELEDKTLEEAVDDVVEEMFERGYLGDESNSVLVSIDGNEELSTKITEKINKTFERHGKKACVITQGMTDEVKKAVKELAEEYNISKGKANIIAKITEEFPNLNVEELAELRMNDLALMLEGTSEKAKSHFKRHGEINEDMYVGRDKALEIALTNAGITEDSLLFNKVHLSREDGKMIYEVEFVAGTNEYEYEIDATTGEIIEKEIEEYEMPEIDNEIDEFIKDNEDKFHKVFDKLGVDKESIMDELLGGKHHGERPESRPEGGNHGKIEYPISRAEAIEVVMAGLELTMEQIEEIDVKYFEGKNGVMISVKLELKDESEYRVKIEAYTGIIIKAELDGVEVEVKANDGVTAPEAPNEAPAEDAPAEQTPAA